MTTQLVLAVQFNVVMVAVLLFASFRGGKPERFGAAINLAGFVATTVLRLVAWDVGWAPGQISVFAIDACVAAGFFWLAVTTTRFWPIWAAGFALANLFMSACGALMPGLPLFAYHTGLGIYAYLALGALAVGTARLTPCAEPYIQDESRRS